MRFFFYGTLISCRGGGAVGAALGKLDGGVPGVARGHLHAVPDPGGWYPAFRPDPAGGTVHGGVFAAGTGFGAADLAALDAYEDFRPGDPAGSEYLRGPLLVTVAGVEVMAQSYVYHAPLPPGARPIRAGDFAGFLAASGVPAYRPGGAAGADSGA